VNEARPRFAGHRVPRALLGLTLACCARDARAPSGGLGRHTDEESFAHEEIVEPYVPYAKRLAGHRTRLLVRGPSASTVPAPPPLGVSETRFPSEVGPLRAWIKMPALPRGPRPPVVVVLHNAFSLQPTMLDGVRELDEAGFALFLPSWRGEDGNPGDLELLYGEVRDAIAAVRFAQSLPGVEGRCLYVIGHSIGGGLAALLALHDTPVRMSASVGGMYRAHTFHDWATQSENRHLVRFDLGDPQECTLRLFFPNAPDLKHRHVTYAGRDDDFDVRYARIAAARAAKFNVPFESVEVRGDHMTSLPEAVADFRGRLERDVVACVGPQR
jgi:dienelactone hydrolase